MMSMIYPMQSTNEERRFFVIRIDQLERANKTQKEKRKKAEEDLRQEIRKNRQLEHNIDKLQKEILKYKEMLFGSKKKSPIQHLPKEGESSRVFSLHKKSVGGQPGHKGHHTEKPVPDHIERLRLTHCDTCGTPLHPGNDVESHTVIEIPHPHSQRATTTRYDIERQWCSGCHREIHALPPDHVLPGVGFGINLLTTVLAWRNHFHDPLNKMVERLSLSYGVDISAGSLQNLLNQGQKLLKKRQEAILKDVRGSPIKHVDETGWKVNGERTWIFGYSTKHLSYYEVSESRGKYALDDMLSGSYGREHTETGESPSAAITATKSLLVSDSYAPYDDTPFDHQSCWSHHLRKSHEAAAYTDASQEAKDVHLRLVQLFDFLHTENQKPFIKKHREIIYAQAMQRIDTFLSTPYQNNDAVEVQTRIRNQRNTLARALLHEQAPLTNNQAERDMRPMVIKRKISGGSRSWKGANATATNTSVIATIRKQQLPLFNTLKGYLLGNVE